ncbi:unnamed protein product [Phytophthora fragariaefolia]|uniref:Unnamed protein product n=1 Tax=Phytophthora fragariaefolia TaxID=1490495 RepID=A0A9W6U7G7_9STRA|nr:unnamed protein product [Phytophthora fragariaefolia]
MLKKDVVWDWHPEHQDAFEAVNKSLASAPVVMLIDTSRPFHAVCDASDFAIGCALMQFDDEGRERVVGYQSRQMEPAERNDPVHDKELLAMHYALIKFRVYLLGEQTFAVYTDHASLRTAMKSPHLSQHPDNKDDDEDCAVCMELGIYATVSRPVLSLRQQITDAYDDVAFYAGSIRYLRNPTADALAKLSRPTRDTITRYDLDRDLLTYTIDTFDTPRVVIPADDDLRARLLHEYHDAPASGHLGRVKTFAATSRDFFWPRMNKCIHKWVRSCEVCQCVKPTTSKQAPLRLPPIATSSWRSISMDFIFRLPRNAQGRTSILVFVDRFSKMVHLAPVAAEVTADEPAELFLDLVFRHHGLPESSVSDRDPRFTSVIWTRLFALLGTRLLMSTAARPDTDGQTERVNRVLENVHVVEGHALHGVAYEELAAVDTVMPAAPTVANFAPKPTPTPIDSATVSELLLHRQAAADQQKANADRRGWKNMLSFRRGDRVLLSMDGIQGSAVTNLSANKLAPRFIGPFKILNVIGDAYTLAVPTSMRLHPTFYVGTSNRMFLRRSLR